MSCYQDDRDRDGPRSLLLLTWSISSLNSRAKMITSPSWGVGAISSTLPKGFKTDGTYVINPPKECMFYIIASRLPSEGMSISMVCYDETLEKYPWLAPADSMKLGGCQDEYSALPEGMKSKS